jgi:hypothetical protein
VGGHAAHGVVVVPGEVTPGALLHLDDSCTEIAQVPTAERRRHGLLE